MQNALADTVYLVIGASGGIGSAVVRQLTAGGARVGLAGRDASKLDALAASVDGCSLTMDATDADAVQAGVQRTLEWGGRLDGVLNCAGSILLKPAHLTTPDEFQQVLATNLLTAFNTVRAASVALRKTGGSVVLMGTAAATIGLANHEAIAAAKAGVVGLMRSAAASYAASGIRFNAVAPGLVETSLSRRITENEMALKASRAMHPLGRIGQPAEIATAVCWLLSPASGWVTGQVIALDGGLSTLKTRARA